MSRSHGAVDLPRASKRSRVQTRFSPKCLIGICTTCGPTFLGVGLVEGHVARTPTRCDIAILGSLIMSGRQVRAPVGTYSLPSLVQVRMLVVVGHPGLAAVNLSTGHLDPSRRLNMESTSPGSSVREEIIRALGHSKFSVQIRMYSDEYLQLQSQVAVKSVIELPMWSADMSTFHLPQPQALPLDLGKPMEQVVENQSDVECKDSLGSSGESDEPTRALQAGLAAEGIVLM